MHENTVRRIILAIFSAFFLAIFFVVTYPYLFGEHWIDSNKVYEFQDVVGPKMKTVLKKSSVSNWRDYEQGNSNRLAILLTNPNSSWLGLVHGLKTIGVPFRITDEIDKAIQHKVMLVYPAISGKLLTQKKLKKIADYAQQGGNIVAVNVLGGGLESIFGFKSVKSSVDHNRVVLQAGHAITKKLMGAELSRIKLSTKNKDELSFGTHVYQKPKHRPIAVYNDNSPAIVFNKYKKSQTYAIGFDVGFYLLKAYNRRLGTVAKTYVNDFESSVDNLLRLIKAIYIRHEPAGLTLGTVPKGRDISVILTHDIDYNRSLENALVYAKHEFDEKISATHFIQTKYVHDWNDKVFFDDKNINNLKKLKTLNVEVGSHSVSHSLSFSKFLVGNGEEKYPEYVPFVHNESETYNGTILGELRVSKFLIDYFLPNSSVVSFRPGHLSNPLSLPESLQATGYRYSSSVTANVSMTHLPFQLNYNRDIYNETSVFEFPITIEDELPPRMGERVEHAIELAHKIKRYGGIYVVLIHPNIIGHKFDFQKRLVTAVKPFSWFGSLNEFGDWWSARNKVSVDISSIGKKHHLVLGIPDPIDGLVLDVPRKWKLLKNKKAKQYITKQRNRIILKEVRGNVDLYFKR